MKFTIWTYLFQIINFFVLLAILRRVLYKPVKETMERRRASVRKELADAEKMRQEALALKEEYEKKLAEVALMAGEMREKTEAEMAELRKTLLKKAENEAEARIQREKSRLEAERKRMEEELTEQVIEGSLTYSTAVLSNLADANLHQRIIQVFLEQFPSMIGEISTSSEPSLAIVSAYPLPDQLSSALERGLRDIFPGVQAAVSIDPGLIAGVVVSAGDRVFDASLKGQLAAFGQRLRRTDRGGN